MVMLLCTSHPPRSVAHTSISYFSQTGVVFIAKMPRAPAPKPPSIYAKIPQNAQSSHSVLWYTYHRTRTNCAQVAKQSKLLS